MKLSSFNTGNTKEETTDRVLRFPQDCDGCQRDVTIMHGERAIYTRVADLRDLLKNTMGNGLPIGCNSCINRTLQVIKKRSFSPDELTELASLEGGNPNDILLNFE